jgi:hypothetical protein
VKRQAEIAEWLPGGLSPRAPAATAAPDGANGTVDLHTPGVRDILGWSGHV